jgi:hypothetical protein
MRGWCAKRESNPCLLLGREQYYHYTIGANKVFFTVWTLNKDGCYHLHICEDVSLDCALGVHFFTKRTKLLYLDNVGIEPTTFRLQSERSTPELIALQISVGCCLYMVFFFMNFKKKKEWSIWGLNPGPWRYQHHALPLRQ